MSRIYDMATGECLYAPDDESARTSPLTLPALALQMVEATESHRIQRLPPDLAGVSAAHFVDQQN
jgi:hypothetical protein